MIDDSELRDLDPFDLLDAEARRLEGFFATLDGEDWLRPTRCAGWRRRELLAHLAAGEAYNRATIDGSLQDFLAAGTAAGATDLASFNDWGVRVRAERTPEELLDEWRAACARNRHDLRELGWDGTLQTAGAGPYPAGRQALHLAQEFAIHADDMGVPVADGERRLRGEWQARFARFTVREYGRDVEVVSDGAGMNTVRAAGLVVGVDDERLVDACSARLPGDAPVPEPVRDLLRVFA
ncbi:MAG TPA: maleylpyruvate isomerase family mycothiol-dependent enzyme [Candidatus Angelobacter sp.]|jgi:uncharacterized protein (TIGR03083 family)|nr:maleylpyruvate isomerase family mycothiol-dependent enzyme [Candidatus Angelobacter sp.]